VFALCDTYTVLRRSEVVAKGLVAEATPDQLVEHMIGRKPAVIRDQRGTARGNVALEARGVKTADLSLRDVNLSVHAGEVLGVAGVAGSGQSEFVDALMGLRDFAGSIRVLGRDVGVGQTRSVREQGVALVPEDRNEEGLWGDVSCFENSIIGLEDRFTRHSVLQTSAIKEAASEWARDFDVRAASLEAPAGSLSGGNQQKLLFAREVSGREPKLLVCMQPTRGVDLGAIELIHAKILALREQGLAVLVVSSELDELTALCDRICVFYNGSTVAEFVRGDFDSLKIGQAMTGARREVEHA
jgi:ABC-type uncharacterized transport system ATPase subunit